MTVGWKTFRVQCECKYPDHTLRFNLFDWDSKTDPYIEVQPQLTPEKGFF